MRQEGSTIGCESAKDAIALAGTCRKDLKGGKRD
jgi:hypothetical protein